MNEHDQDPVYRYPETEPDAMPTPDPYSRQYSSAYGTTPYTPPYGSALPQQAPQPQQAQPQQIEPQPPRQPEPAPNRGFGSLLAGVTVLALIVGGAAGGVGGYLVAERQQQSATVNSLEEPVPTKNTGNAPKGSLEAVAAKVSPSVVQLQVAGQDGMGEGSGFVITDDGFIVTNNHVVESAADGGKIRAVFADGRKAPVDVVGRDSSSDVAVVKADGVSGLTPVELGRSDGLRVGQQVVAIGSPFELSGTVTSGIVSSLNRPVVAGRGEGQSTVMDAIQTDAAINPGNSGGPLTDMNGRVIGINSAIYSPRSGMEGAGNVGIGFAIPIDQARRTAEEIMKTGKASQTYIGAHVRDAENGGALIAKVEDESPAAQAGLKQGDIVTKLGDRAILNSDELVAAVRAHAAGEKVTLELQSGRAVELTLGSRPVEGG